jgi:hypothetical protein
MNPHDVVKFDLRTETGIKIYESKQAVPIIINQCIVRCFYLIKRLIIEIKNKNIKLIKELRKLEPRNFLPCKSRCMTRMLTVSTGIFSVVDFTDAFIKVVIRNPRNRVSFLKEFLCRINFYGIASFTVAVRNDAKYIKDDVNDIFSIKAEKILKVKHHEIMPSIDVEVNMDNSNLYEYAFDSLYKTVTQNKKRFTESHKVVRLMTPQIIDMGDDNFHLYERIIFWSRHATVYETERLIVRMFGQNNVPYESVGHNSKWQRLQLFAFIREENGKKIGYIFSLEPRLEADLKTLKETGVDGVNVIALINPQDQNYVDELKTIFNEAEKKYGGFIKFKTLKDFFRLFGNEEFTKYMGYAEHYNERVKKLLGYDTVIMPSDQAVHKFRTDKSLMLSRHQYQSMLPSEIYEEQVNKLTHNYLERGLYRAMTGNSNFADSFISSEWYYSIHKATGSLEQTAVVVGYLKSIEQLLYAIVRLSIDNGKTIKKKGTGDFIPYTTEDEGFVDTMLGSLIGFMKYYTDIYDVNGFLKRHIITTLNEYRDKYRNDHMHKDNVYKDKEIEEIRAQTIYVYFLILGGCRIRDEDFQKLGIAVTQDDSAEMDETPLLPDFEAWLNPILSFDPLINASVIFFELSAIYDDHVYELRLNTTSKYDESGYAWVLADREYPFDSDPFVWHSGCTKEEAQEQVVDLLKQYLNSGQQAGKLRDHNFVVIGYIGQVECVYKKVP